MRNPYGNEDIDRYLSISDREKAGIERHKLAAQGPDIVPLLLKQTVLKIKEQREALGGVFSGPYAAIYLQLLFDQASDLLLEMVGSSSRISQAVTQLLVGLIQNNNPGIRALACILAGLPGMTYPLIAEPLIRQFQSDENFVVKLAAAAHLQGHSEMRPLISPSIRQLAYQLVGSYLKMPVKKNEKEKSGELFRIMIIQRFPQILALQDETY